MTGLPVDAGKLATVVGFGNGGRHPVNAPAGPPGGGASFPQRAGNAKTRWLQRPGVAKASDVAADASATANLNPRA